MSKKPRVEKSRYWGFLIYPESVNPDYINILTLTGLPMSISPLHDADFNSDETQKKPHYHVLLAFDGPTTEAKVQSISDSVGGTHVIAVASCRGMYRYHCHLDNPEKTQYDDSFRRFINGFDINNYSSMTSSEELMLIQQIMVYINSENIYEYCDLVTFLMDNDLQAFDYVVHHTIYFSTFLTSLRNKIKDQIKNQRKGL